MESLWVLVCKILNLLFLSYALLSDGSDADAHILLENIREVIPYLNNLGNQQGATLKRYMMTLYAASSIENLKGKGSSGKDGYNYFTLYQLEQIAHDSEKILREKIHFDRPGTAYKIYTQCENNGFIKFLPRDLISKKICRGDTLPVAITPKGKKYCQTLLDELLSPAYRLKKGNR